MDTEKKPEPVDPSAATFPGSANEPAGAPADNKPHEDPPEAKKDQPLPSKDELEAMTRAELDELAEARGVHVTTSMNKGDVIDEMRRDARRRR